MAAIVPLGIDCCASLKSPDLFEPAIIPLEQQHHTCICCGSILSLVQIFVSFVLGYGNV